MSADALAADFGREVWNQRNCGRCHGGFAEGRPCHDIPRLAGMPADYLRRRLGDHPYHPANPYTPGAARLASPEIDALSHALATLDLRGDPRFDVRQTTNGDLERGARIYRDECRICHGRTGYGREAREGARAMPPLAGQLPGYLQRAIREFQQRRRVHDDTPDDDLFDRLNPEELQDLTAYLASLDDVPPGAAAPPPLPLPQCPRR